MDDEVNCFPHYDFSFTFLMIFTFLTDKLFQIYREKPIRILAI